MSDKPIIKTANERLSDYLKNLDPHFNQFAIAAVTEKVLPQFQTEEIRELRTAYEALKAENEALRKQVAELKTETAKDHVKIMHLKDALSAYGDPDVFADDED